MKENLKGAVTIFLILVLVPMLTVTSLFVDGAKYQLAKSVVESSAQVAIDSALTSYDLDLKDIYGLFATAQDMKEVYNNCEEYFKEMISMNGFSEEDTNDTISKIMKALKFSNDSGEITNFLQMSLLEDTSASGAKGATISGVEGATLANATIMKQQVVDFMKYRSPINTGLSFVEGLNAFKTLNDQKKLVDARQEYYKEQSKVMQKLKAAWDELAAYNALDISGTGEKEHEHFYLEEAIKSYFDSRNIEDVYAQLITLYFKNIAYSSYSYDNKNDETYLVEAVAEKITQNSVRTDIGTDKTYSSDSISESIINNLLEQLEKQCNSIGSFQDFMVCEDDRYQVQYWLRNISTYKTYSNKVIEIIKLKNGLLNALEAAKEHDSEEEDKYNKSVEVVNKGEEGAELYEPEYILKDTNIELSCNKIISGVYQGAVTNFDASVNGRFAAGYDNANSVSGYGTTYKYTGIGDANSSLSAVIEVTSCSETVYIINDTVQGISSTLTEMYDTATKMHSHLNLASLNIKSAIESIQSEDLNKAKTKWQNCANKTTINQTSQAQQDQQELKDLDSAFDIKSMQELKNSIDEIKAKLDELIKQIDAFKYNSKPIKDINSFESFKNATGTITHNTLKKSELESKAASYKTNTYQSGKMNTSWLSEHSTRLNLSAHNNCVNDFKFYKYLVKQFSNKTGTKANEDAYNNLKSTVSNNAASAVNTQSDVKVKNKTVTETNLPSAGNSNNDLNSNKTAVTDVDNNKDNTVMSSGNLFTELANMGANFIDNLYVADYILSMFSYNTISTKEPDAKEEPKPQTLTLKDINADNNKYYLGEVEYIIFGGKDTNENVSTAYASIFGVRLAFNLIYAFSASEIRDVAMSIAAGISAATCGLVPAPLIQAVIIIAAACMESGIDISLLKQHEKIVLFKTQSTWQTSLNNLKNYLTTQGAKLAANTANKAIDKGAEAITKLLDATDEEITKIFNSNKQEINNYIDRVVNESITNMSKEVIQQFNTATNNIVCKYLQSGGIIVDDKGNTVISFDETQYNSMIDEINKNLDEWKDNWQISNQNVNPIITSLQEKAVTIVKKYVDKDLINMFASYDENNIEDEINEIITLITDEIDAVISAASDSINNIKNSIKENIQNSINKGAEQLKNTIQKEMLSLCGDSGTNASYKNTGQYSILSFSYEDYLRFFCMVAFYTNEEPTLLRIADLIQINIAKINSTEKSQSTFNLSKSYAFLELSANVQTKPLLIGLDLFSDYLKNGSDDSSWSVEGYKLYKGY